MSRWHSLLEIVQFPLKVLFFGTLLLGIGTTALNQNLSFLWTLNNPMMIKLFELIRYVGASIVDFFPLLVFIHLLAHKFESSIIVILGIVSYLIINITMVFFLNNDFPLYFYQSVIGPVIDFNQINGVVSGTLKPYNTGIFALFFAYFATKYAYLKSRKYSIFGITSFVDHDAMAGILVSLLSFVIGLFLAFTWPIGIHLMQNLFDLIANDTTNPINLFLYGIFDRLGVLLGMGSISRSVFWFAEQGGSWLNNVGIKFTGDVGVWTAQTSSGVGELSAGTFITPYYLINLFIVPAYYIAYYRLSTSKKDRKRYLPFVILAIAISVICGNPLPAEIMLLILSPMVYAIYLVLVGLLYAFLPMLNIVIGYSFNELMILANPGSGMDLLKYIRNPYLASSILRLVVIGLVIGFIFYHLVRVYFRKYAIGLFQMIDKDQLCESIINDLGGIDNIVNSNATPDKLNVEFENSEVVNYDDLRKYGAYMMLESKDGYLIRLGNVSTILHNYIQTKKKEKTELNNEELKK